MKKMLKDWRLVLALAYLSLLGLLGILSDSIASSDGWLSFGPHDVSSQAEIFSPPGTVESSGDTKKVHVLGTDQIGRDVASRLIHGIPVAFAVGIFSSLITLIIALIFGVLSGYVGDNTHRVSLMHILLFMFLFGLLHFYAREYSFGLDREGVVEFQIILYFLIMFLGTSIITVVLSNLSFKKIQDVRVPWDSLVLRLIEIFKSIPRLFLLLAFFAVITSPSILWVVLIIGFIRWPGLTRIIRAEILNLKQEPFIKSAELMGLSKWKIISSHILPNIYQPILILTAFNMGSAILIESSLSFLQIGIPGDAVSWGRMLGDARQQISAWWLAIGPGLLIFSMILCFNTIGNRLSLIFEKNQLI